MVEPGGMLLPELSPVRVLEKYNGAPLATMSSKAGSLMGAGVIPLHLIDDVAVTAGRLGRMIVP